MRTLLDVYEAVVAEVGPLPPWTLVIEHALLSDAEQRARAVRAGFGVTVQHALLWNMGSEMLITWGPERTRQVNPLDEWLAAGADLAAGTDIVRPFNPMTNVWGMVTRGTKSAGIQGPEHAIGIGIALELYTIGTARLNHEPGRLGTITGGPRRLPHRPAHGRPRRPGRPHADLHHGRRPGGTRRWWDPGRLTPGSLMRVHLARVGLPRILLAHFWNGCRARPPGVKRANARCAPHHRS